MLVANKFYSEREQEGFSVEGHSTACQQVGGGGYPSEQVWTSRGVSGVGVRGS